MHALRRICRYVEMLKAGKSAHRAPNMEQILVTKPRGVKRGRFAGRWPPAVSDGVDRGVDRFEVRGVLGALLPGVN